MKQRVIVIGLDGATFDAIDPATERGELPNIEGLIKSGTRGCLLSTIPYATMPAWPSFMTGKNSGKHSVFDFFTFKDGQRRIANSRDVRSLTLWDVLSACGKRSIVVNVPGTYPPARIDGVMVSGMLTPAGATCVSPPEIKAFLDQVTGGYQINSRSDLSGAELVKDAYVVTRKQQAGFLALLKNQAWDLAVMMFRITDVLQHTFWGEPNVIRECYQYVDGLIGEIIAAFPDAAIFMISDHGFQEQRKDFHVNKWLIDQGYMHIRTGTGTEISRWEEIGRLEGRAEHAAAYIRRSSRSRFLVRLGLTRQRLRKVIPRACWSSLKGLMPSLQDRIPESADASYDVDWEHTQASAYQLFGMESKAVKVTIVDQVSREKLCSELVEKLEQLRDPQTGDRFVRRAYRREELYAGPYVDQAPDIVLDLHDGYNITNSFFAADYVTPREQVRGCHHREGIFVASGDGILSGKALGSPPSLLDVMPSVLHYMGLPIPNDCDGEVLREIFDPDSEVYQREALREEMLWKERDTDGSLSYDEGEQAEIEERLRALGYL